MGGLSILLGGRGTIRFGLDAVLLLAVARLDAGVACDIGGRVALVDRVLLVLDDGCRGIRPEQLGEAHLA